MMWRRTRYGKQLRDIHERQFIRRAVRVSPPPRYSLWQAVKKFWRWLRHD